MVILYDPYRRFGLIWVHLGGFWSISALRGSWKKFLGTKSFRNLVGNTFKQFPGTLEHSRGGIRAKSSPDPTQFPKLVRFDFDQLSTSLGDTVVISQNFPAFGGIFFEKYIKRNIARNSNSSQTYARKRQNEN